MTFSKNHWIFVLAMNLIRIALGSYFIGVALDLIPGVNQRALFLPYMTYELADLVGSGLLFCIGVAFMTGLMTRTYALALAMFVMCSSVVQNFFPFDVEHLTEFWRDITLSAAVLMAYTNVGQVELQKLTLPRRASRSSTTSKHARVATHPIETAQSE